MVMHAAVVPQHPLENVAGFRPGILVLPQFFEVLAAGGGLQLADGFFALHQLVGSRQVFTQECRYS